MWVDAIAVTGLGAVSAAGPDTPSLVSAIAAGRSGIGPVRRFDAGFVPDAVAGEVQGLGAHDEPCIVFAARAAAEAWRDAGLVDGRRVAVVVGTSSGPHLSEEVLDALEAADPEAAAGIERRDRLLAVGVAAGDAVGAGGPRITVSTACASGLSALAFGMDLLRVGRVDAVLAGGAEGLSARRMAGFEALGALSRGPCAPFSQPVGMTLGEGAAFVVLERADDARERGARIRGYLLGSGSSCDAVHATAPDPRGDGIARSIVAALGDADLAAPAVDWVSAHATGTEANDSAEWLAILRVFDAPPPVTGLKSFFGHSFGAAGALEAVVAILALEARAIPPTLRFVGPRAIGPRDPVGEGIPRPAHLRTVVVNNAAFGGANATIVLGADGSGRERDDRRVSIVGVGRAASDAPPHRGADREPDPGARMLASAAEQALDDAGIRVGRTNRDGIGLWVAASRRPVAASAAYRRSIVERGLGGASAAAFARTVTNAAAGEVCRVLGLRGPTSAISSGPGSALIALIGAARLVARGAAEEMVVGAVDEADPVLAGRSWESGAAAVVLSAGVGCGLAGFGLTGPGHLAEAVREACERRPERVWSTGSRERAVIDEVLGDVPIEACPEGYGESSTALLAVAEAVAWLRQRGVGTALIVSDDPQVGAVAVRLEIS